MNVEDRVEKMEGRELEVDYVDDDDCFLLMLVPMGKCTHFNNCTQIVNESMGAKHE